MKYYLFLLVTAITIQPLFAQQTPKADDALLLDYYQNQRFSEAADHLKSTYPEPVTDIKVLGKLAYTSLMATRLVDAEGYYQRIYNSDSTNTAILFNLGSINARRGNSLKAIGFYKKILLKDSLNFSVYKQLATLSQNTGDIAATITYLQKANKINPAEPDVAYDLGTFYISLKQYGIADTVVSKAILADTGNLLLLSGKAQINYRLEKYPETIDVCNKLIKAGDHNGIIISMLGSSHYLLKNYDLCISTFQMMEQTKTSNETSYYYTAMSYKALGKQAQAVTYLDKAIEQAVSPNVDSYYSEKGDSYQRLHKLKDAVAAYQKSLLYDVKPITYYALASLYDADLKNKHQAKKYYQKYLKSKPPEKQQTFINYSKSRIAQLN